MVLHGRRRVRRALHHRHAVLLGAVAGVLLALATPVAPQPRVETIATGLEVPWALAFAPDGRLFVTERPGRIRVAKDGRLDPAPVATLAVAAQGEAGLMGLALDPRFAETGHLYVCYTARRQDDVVNRIVRLTLRGGRAGDERVLLDGMRGAGIHDGCRLKFGPDGKLYATMGDAAEPRLAQARDSLNGKTLRLEADGSVPADNPFRGSPVWSLGHRNPQGLAWDGSKRLLAAEHGPSAHDEVNHILPGKNYGWPDVTGADEVASRRHGFVDPIVESERDTWAPSGIAWLGDSLWVAALRGERLLRITLDADLKLLNVGSILRRAHGRLRDVVVGPDGALYVTTSNRDGRGTVREGDDKILRVQP
jgi:glucose/arabinose dehydrogenase